MIEPRPSGDLACKLPCNSMNAHSGGAAPSPLVLQRMAICIGEGRAMTTADCSKKPEKYERKLQGSR
jgi:hypothetical protein